MPQPKARSSRPRQRWRSFTTRASIPRATKIQQEQKHWDGDFKQEPDDTEQEKQPENDQNGIPIAPKEPAREKAVPPGAIRIFLRLLLLRLVGSEPIPRLPHLMVVGDPLPGVKHSRQHGQPDGPPDSQDDLDLDPPG
jgi:hypothetical protein